MDVVTLNSSTRSMPARHRLPPLPFSNESLAEHLHSAIKDLDNMIAIDQWEQEFYDHFERRFRHNYDKRRTVSL